MPHQATLDCALLLTLISVMTVLAWSSLTITHVYKVYLISNFYYILVDIIYVAFISYTRDNWFNNCRRSIFHLKNFEENYVAIEFAILVLKSKQSKTTTQIQTKSKKNWQQS